MDNKQLATAIITEIAQGLQEFVYNRQEGDINSPADSIVYASYTQVNDLLITTAKKYGVGLEEPEVELTAEENSEEPKEPIVVLNGDNSEAGV